MARNRNTAPASCAPSEPHPNARLRLNPSSLSGKKSLPRKSKYATSCVGVSLRGSHIARLHMTMASPAVQSCMCVEGGRTKNGLLRHVPSYTSMRLVSPEYRTVRDLGANPDHFTICISQQWFSARLNRQRRRGHLRSVRLVPIQETADCGQKYSTPTAACL